MVASDPQAALGQQDTRVKGFTHDSRNVDPTDAIPTALGSGCDDDAVIELPRPASDIAAEWDLRGRRPGNPRTPLGGRTRSHL